MFNAAWKRSLWSRVASGIGPRIMEEKTEESSHECNTVARWIGMIM